MGKLKTIFSSVKVIVLVICIILAIVSINPNPWREGVAIRSITSNSTANQAGMVTPSGSITPMARERILELNDKPILNLRDYSAKTKDLKINSTLKIETDQKTYYLMVKPNIEVIILPELEPKEITETLIDPETNETVNVTKTIYVNKTAKLEHGPKELGIEVYEVPANNIRKGLELQGGTRVLLEPESLLSLDEINMLIDSMKERLNVYGLSDIIVTQANDLPEYLGGSGKQYILIEIAGVSKQEVTELLAKQGKFEAKIGDETVFVGGRDITYVCRDATCAGIDPSAGCQPSSGTWVCRFRFSIALTPEAADRQAQMTVGLDIQNENGQEYLSKDLTLYLDDVEVDKLKIGADLKGRAVTDIQISGSGGGASQQDAMSNSLEQMKKLQTVLKTGSLPVKLNIVNIEAISPTLGTEFINNSFLIALLAILSVSTIIYIKYRLIKILIPLVTSMVCEIIFLLGTAALIGWNMDLSAIAGIIIAIGTGVDNLIVITDEVLAKETLKDEVINWKQRIKQGLEIIMGAYLTTFVAMVPLLFAGAGLLKGFAITTIIGASFGVFIARPAYAAAIEIILREE